jgi:hypothetical protein
MTILQVGWFDLGGSRISMGGDRLHGDLWLT